MRRWSGRLMRWAAWVFGAVIVLLGLYLSIFFFPYPAFPHHAGFAGFSVYSDAEIPEGFELVFEDARRRVAAMPLYRGEAPPRIFVCRSQRLFTFFNRLAGKRHFGQGLVISAAGNVFLSAEGIESVGRRNRSRPAHSRLEGSWSAAVAHEVAHHLVVVELGFKRAKRLPAWKSEGYTDYSASIASVASNPDGDLHGRVSVLLDDTAWQHPAGSIDRRHFRWHLLVEYLCAVKGLAFSDLLDDALTETEAWNEMMVWYRAHGPDTRA